MNLIQELMERADDVIAKNGFDEILNRLAEMRQLMASQINEGFMDNHRGDLERKFDELENQLIAARRRLGEVNTAQMSDEDRTEHKSIVMGRINQFRKQLLSVMADLNMPDKEKQFHLNRIGLDREFGKPSETFTRRSPDENKAKFSDHVNRQRNFAPPSEVKDFVQPKKQDAPQQRKWYQRLFGR